MLVEDGLRPSILERRRTMALWRNIGGLTTIVQGAQQYWEYTYGGRDIGLAIAAPNMQEGQINLEMVVIEQGVVQRDSGNDSPLINYTARIQNLGPGEMFYNINVGDWQ
jgi:hypothetical protein